MISKHNLLKLTAFLFLAVRSPADPILSLTFDDPNSVLSAFPEGISLTELQSTNALRDANIASGSGGEAQLTIGGEELPEGVTESPRAFQIITDTTMGTKAFLRLIYDREIPADRNLVIRPSGFETSLASLSQIENGKVVINGGLDMFFRYSEEGPSQPELLPNLLSTGGNGLRLIVESDEGSIAANLFVDQEEAIFDTDLDDTPDTNKVKTTFAKAAPIDPEAPYHLAVSFGTDEAGVVTLKVFLKNGNGAINTKLEDDLVAQATFKVITENQEMSLEKGSISFGAHSRSSPSKVILDLAAFRIFKPAPEIFPDIAGQQ
jgi:hypothetical protein